MRVLLVEDEGRIQQIVSTELTHEGFDVELASTAEQAMGTLSRAPASFDVFVLDIVLPGLSGLDLCRWMRQLGHREPIVLLTAKGSLEEKIAGLDAGADDYMTKPFAVAELRARFRALLRKAQGYPRETLVLHDLSLDPGTRQVQRGGQVLALTAKETDLLEYLMVNSDRVLTRSMIAAALWESDTSPYTGLIDVFIQQLGRKVDAPGRVKLVHSVRGKGFLLSRTLGNQP